MQIIVICLALFISKNFVVLEAFSQTGDGASSQEKVVSDSETKNVKDETEEPDQDSLIPNSGQVVQFCQGKYNKKGIGGIEIVTVECPNVTDVCNCEVSKNNLLERVNCGGAIKNSSERSQLISCDSTIINK